MIRTMRSFLHNAMGLASIHLQFFQLDLQEEKSRFARQILLLIMALFFAGMLLIALTFFVLILCWEQHRIAAIVGIVIFYAIGLGVLLYRLWCFQQRAVSPFAATLAEIRKTQEMFREDT